MENAAVDVMWRVLFVMFVVPNILLTYDLRAIFSSLQRKSHSEVSSLQKLEHLTSNDIVKG
jgi:hypothetical protein